MDEHLQVIETGNEFAAETSTEMQVQALELQTSNEVLMKLDEIQSSVEHVSVLLIIIFSFFAGFVIARTAVEAFFKAWK